ncbi:MAG: hypothetical protein KTR30_24445 [Saprospiraceae bacterium]|nr:hypothetical protein [Saprospiraceae bacterium]
MSQEGTEGQVETMGELVLVKTIGKKHRRLKKRILEEHSKIKIYPNPFTTQIHIVIGKESFT